MQYINDLVVKQVDLAEILLLTPGPFHRIGARISARMFPAFAALSRPSYLAQMADRSMLPSAGDAAPWVGSDPQKSAYPVLLNAIISP
jgi:hypothetical protein